MKVGEIKKVNHDFESLYRKGDKFKIIRLNKDEDLMPIEAMRLKNRQIYGFEENELE